MAKKYLLYIHDELFDKEPHKSQLVNNLLRRHYHDTVNGKSHAEIKKTVYTKAKLLCEHYQIKGQCLNKGCKYGK